MKRPKLWKARSLKDLRLSRLAKNIKIVFLDNDGVINSGQIVDPGGGNVVRIRCYYDGQGITWLRAIGVRVVVLTGEDSSDTLMQLIERWNGLPSAKTGKLTPIEVFSGIPDTKLEVAKFLLKKYGLTFSVAAAMGDDIADYNLLDRVQVPACPAQAEQLVKDLVTRKQGFVAPRVGGNGAVRDFANFLLESKQVDVRKLPIK